MKYALYFYAALLACFTPLSSQSFRIFDVKDYGAHGDGITADTRAIQSAINDASVSGGKVLLAGGRFLSGTIFMKSNVTLEIAEGAVLLGSTHPGDYPDTISNLQSYNDIFLSKSLIYGDNLSNISIAGKGTIDGQGAAFRVTTKVKPDRYRNRPFGIRFIRCTNILIENIRMRNSAMWMQHYLACEFLTIRGITVYNHANQNNDMMDIDGCKNVIISDCFGDTDDDALTLKSTSGFINENITVTNCVLSSHVNGIKFGTETIGGFKNISISNIVIKPSEKKETIFGLPGGIGGIVLEIVDGGTMEGVTISNVAMNGVQTPIFMRLGNRGRTIREGMPKPAAGVMNNIRLANITAVNAGNIGSSIHGIPGHRIENIFLDNISLAYAGGEMKSVREIPEEKEEEYPESSMFGTLPAYGFFIRHASGVHLRGITLTRNSGDNRPAVMLDDIEEADLDGVQGMIGPGAESFLKFVNVRNAFIDHVRPHGSTGAFLSAAGGESANINLYHNDYSSAKNIVTVSEEPLKSKIRIHK